MYLVLQCFTSRLHYHHANDIFWSKLFNMNFTNKEEKSFYGSFVSSMKSKLRYRNKRMFMVFNGTTVSTKLENEAVQTVPFEKHRFECSMALSISFLTYSIHKWSWKLQGAKQVLWCKAVVQFPQHWLSLSYRL